MTASNHLKYLTPGVVKGHSFLLVGTWILCLCFGPLSSSLRAESHSELVVQLIERVGNVEAENRELRGQIEEARHELSTLQQRLETLSSDVDYRLSSVSTGAPQTQSAASVQPTGPAAPQDPRLIPNSPTDFSLQASAPLASSQEKASTAPLTIATPGKGNDDYENARSLLERGDYEAAERAFSAFVTAHPKDTNAGAAQYWLGVTYFVRGQHEKAASTFAKGYKSYPKSSKAPDNLLKLAKSLGALDRKANACTTLDQLSLEYPNVHVGEVAKEKKNLGCK